MPKRASSAIPLDLPDVEVLRTEVTPQREVGDTFRTQERKRLRKEWAKTDTDVLTHPLCRATSKSREQPPRSS